MLHAQFLAVFKLNYWLSLFIPCLLWNEMLQRIDACEMQNDITLQISCHAGYSFFPLGALFHICSLANSWCHFRNIWYHWSLRVSFFYPLCILCLISLALSLNDAFFFVLEDFGRRLGYSSIRFQLLDGLYSILFWCVMITQFSYPNYFSLFL